MSPANLEKINIVMNSFNVLSRRSDGQKVQYYNLKDENLKVIPVMIIRDIMNDELFENSMVTTPLIFKYK